MSRVDTRPMAQRLLEKIDIAENGCWLWRGMERHHGYGGVKINGRVHYAHRVSFTEFVRPLEEGEHVCHHCDNPPCVNPDHLFAGSRSDNMRDMIAKGRSGMKPQPIRHGTLSGYLIHGRRGVPLCDECRAAERAYRKDYRRRVALRNEAAA